MCKVFDRQEVFFGVGSLSLPAFPDLANYRGRLWGVAAINDAIAASRGHTASVFQRLLMDTSPLTIQLNPDTANEVLLRTFKHAPAEDLFRCGCFSFPPISRSHSL